MASDEENVVKRRGARFVMVRRWMNLICQLANCELPSFRSRGAPPSQVMDAWSERA